MHISMELLIVIIIQCITVGIFVGTLKGFQKIVEFRLKALESMNQEALALKERVALLEQSDKTQWKKIDSISKAQA